MKRILIISLFLFFANASDDFYYQKGKKIFLTPIKISEKFQKSDVNKTDIITYYTTQKGHMVGINRELIVKLKEDIPIQNLLDKYAILMKKKLAKNLYLLQVTSTEETLSITNQIYMERDVVYAHPNFIKKMQQR